MADFKCEYLAALLRHLMAESMPILTVESNCLAAASHAVSHVAPVHKLSGAEHYQRTGRDSKYDSALMALLDTMFFQTGKEVQASFFFRV